MGNNCLVTGGAGFIGSHLSKNLLLLGHKVIAIDDLSVSKNRNNLPDKVSLIEEPLEDVKPEYFKDIDIVFHLASISGEAISFYAPKVCFLRNLESSYNLIKCCIAAKVKRIVFTSSMAVYGNRLSPPFSETDAGNPTDPYGISKYATEKLIESYGEIGLLEWNIIRLHNVYGTNINLQDPYRGVVAIFIAHAMRNKPIPIYGDGTQTRAFTFVNDIIPGLIKAGFDSEIKSQILNMGSKQPIRLIDLADMVCEVLGSEKRQLFLPPRIGEAKNAYPTPVKAEKILGFVDKTSLREGLEQTIEWAKKQELGDFDFNNLDFDLDLDGSPIPWASQKYT